jgi:hypothetical protein
MPKKVKSQFHTRLEGTAYETLQIPRTRQAIESAVKEFLAEYPNWETWEALCGIRDHVNALIGANNDLDTAHRVDVSSRIHLGEFVENPKGALDLLNSNPKYTIADLHAEANRQGIPEI